MNGYTIATLVLLASGLPCALFLSSRGRPADRLVGLEMVGAIGTVGLLLFSQVTGESYELGVPLVLVPLSVVGTLVFTKTIDRRSG